MVGYKRTAMAGIDGNCHMQCLIHITVFTLVLRRHSRQQIHRLLREAFMNPLKDSATCIQGAGRKWNMVYMARHGIKTG